MKPMTIDELIAYLGNMTTDSDGLEHASWVQGISDAVTAINANRDALTAGMQKPLVFKIRKCHSFEYDDRLDFCLGHHLIKDLYSADLLDTKGDIHVTGWITRFDSPDNIKNHISEYFTPLGLPCKFID